MDAKSCAASLTLGHALRVNAKRGGSRGKYFVWGRQKVDDFF